MRCHFLLQGIFPTQGSNPGLLHCRQMLYPLSRQGSHGVEEGSPKAKHEGFGSGAACHVRSLGWFRAYDAEEDAVGLRAAAAVAAAAKSLQS